MICVICGKYVARHNLKDAQYCLKLASGLMENQIGE